ncbi:MAG TPA: hypothetical protein VNU68_19375 [Verrucomicrobiae bacterium]|nr:hypothetical protein [Verrucomicrobiae bacterium]
MPQSTSTFKLADVVNQPTPPPLSSSTPFTMRMRDVGWHPDATKTASGGREELFIEEAVGEDKNGFFIPFPVPTSQDPSGNDVPFKEPTQPGDWEAFNRWILGGPVPAATAGEPPLTSLLRELATACRCYNASLYRLRRLHYHFNHPNENVFPPRNPHGDPALPPTPPKTFNQLVADAERDWKQVVIPQIQDLLDNQQTYNGKVIKVIAADMIEVNGYIVSMRVVAEGIGQGLEVGGSSSHVSISSAFSSH